MASLLDELQEKLMEYVEECRGKETSLSDSDRRSEVVAELVVLEDCTGCTVIQFFEQYTDEECRASFRFGNAEIPRLCTALGIPQRIECKDRSVASGMEGLCIFLYRLSYPNRLSSMRKVFGRPKSVLSIIVNEVLDQIFRQHGRFLTDFNQPWLTDGIDDFADAVTRKGAALDNVWGFIDGTVRPICPPGQNQRECYNGHKKVHALKFQSVVTPNGLIANLYGPIEGRRHDSALLRLSGLLQHVERFERVGQPMSLYGDPAYPIRPQLIGPFRGAALTPLEQEFNRTMSKVRTCVEWAFGKIVNLFAFLDFKKNQKLLLQPVGKYYCVASILTNCHTCLYGSETGNYFGQQPPELEDYLNVNQG